VRRALLHSTSGLIRDLFLPAGGTAAGDDDVIRNADVEFSSHKIKQQWFEVCEVIYLGKIGYQDRNPILKAG
jgi:hypothetical protein